MSGSPRLGVLYTLVFLYTAGMGLAFPLVPQFLRLDLGAGPLLVGLVVAVYGVLQVVARVPLGAWADRIGRRSAILAAFLATLAGGAFFALAPSVLWVVPGQVLFALAASAFWVAANAYVVDVLPPDRVPRAMNHYSIAMSLGFLAGPASSALADAVGFRPMLAALSAIGLGGALLALLLLDTGRSDAPISIARSFRRATTFLGDAPLLFSAVGTFTFAILLGSISTFLPLHLRVLNYGAAAVAVIFTVREGASLALRLGFGRFLTAERAAAVMLGGIVLAAASTAAVPLAETATGIALLSIVTGVGIGAVIPANLTLIAAAAPAKERSLAMGLYGTALGIGTSVSPPLLGALAERTSLAATFVASGVAALCLAGVLAWKFRGLVVPARRAPVTLAAPPP